MAISISVLILAIGLISLFTLPVEQYPDIAPPTVYVTASYTGADAEAVMNSVIMPLEESIRFGYYTGLFQAGHGPRYGGSQRAEPCGESAGIASG